MQVYQENGREPRSTLFRQRMRINCGSKLNEYKINNEVVQGGALAQLVQGDLLNACPVTRVRGFEQWPVPVGQPVEVKEPIKTRILLFVLLSLFV